MLGPGLGLGSNQGQRVFFLGPGMRVKSGSGCFSFGSGLGVKRASGCSFFGPFTLHCECGLIVIVLA